MKLLRLNAVLALAGLFITCAKAQNMFIDTSSTIYEYQDGVQSTFASGLNTIGDMTFDSVGDLFVTGGYGKGSGSGLIYEFVNSDGILSSTPLTVITGLTNPGGVTCDSAGDLFVANQGNGQIYEYANQSGTLNSTAITYIGTFSKPLGLAFGSGNNLYVADNNGGDITKVLPPFPDNVYGGSSGAEEFAEGLTYASNLAFDSSGNLYVSLVLENKIEEIAPDGNVTTFATPVYPDAMSFDSNGNLFVAGATGKIYEFVNNDGTLNSTPITTSLSGAGPGIAFQPIPVPEPSTLALAGIGLVSFLGLRRRQR